MDSKKIAFIIDSRGWAFDNIAHQLKQNLKEYTIDIIPGDIFEGNMLRLFLFCEDYDIIHFLWRGFLSLIDRQEMINYSEKILGIKFETFKQKYIYSKKITFSVCDHLYLEGEEKWRTQEIFKYGDMYFTTSKKLYEIYSKFDKKPEMVINDGVDLKKYKPNNLERFKENKIIIGWVGNSRFKDSNNDSDMKGVKGIIEPAVNELRDEGYNIELNLADRNIKMLTQEEMPNYYNSIDIYVCASTTEGTPLTILEAMAMGIPIISTNVGIVPEVLGVKGKKYILEERNKNYLKEKIIQLYNNRQMMEELSKENIERVKQNDWTKISTKYKAFFERIIKL